MTTRPGDHPVLAEVGVLGQVGGGGVGMSVGGNIEIVGEEEERGAQ